MDVVSTFRGRTKPNRATWTIWAVVSIILAASYHSSGANDTIWVPLSYVVGPIIVAILSVKYGEGFWNELDMKCLAAAAASLVLWWIFESALVALLLTLFIDFLGYIPTIKKVYDRPRSEGRLAWTLFFVGHLLNLFAIDSFTFGVVVYPLCMFVWEGTIVALIYFRPLVMANPEITDRIA
jgi:hypothetical protein